MSYGRSMATVEHVVEFERGEVGAVVAEMAELTARGDGQGWINIRPVLSEQDERFVPVRTGLAAWLSGRGPVVAMATWMPPVTVGRPRATQVGIEHGTGPKALPRLADAGLPLPSGWLKRQDHAKHGIVVDLPPDADPAEAVDWMMAATAALMSVVEAGNRWVAIIHRPA